MYCHVYQICTHIIGVYVGTFSLLAAAMKYWFIVHNKTAEKFGKSRTTKIFLFIHLVICLVVPLLNVISAGDHDHIFWVNQCWGDVRPDSRTADTFWNGIKQSLCHYRTYDTESYIGTQASKVLEPILRVMCGGLTIFYFLFLSNISELFLYWRLFKYMDK